MIIRALAAHSPITVLSDEDLAAQASLEGWRGDGSESQPFIIENLEIDASSSPAAIHISGTSAHFIVRNCTLHSGTQNGIYLAVVTNATVVNCTCSSQTNGIVISSSHDITLLDNNFSNAITEVNGVGVGLESSHTNTISNNTCSNHISGIRLAWSDDNTILGNRLVDNSLHTTIGSDSERNLVDGNTYGPTNLAGISINSNYNTISNNTCIGTYISMSGASWCTVEDNIVVGTGYGIYTSSGNSNRYLRNALSDNSYGIGLVNCGSCTITENSIDDSINSGVRLVSSTSMTIDGNIFTNTGITIEGGDQSYWNTHTITSSNLVNGKNIYYIKNTVGSSVPTDAGQIILACCENMLIEGETISSVSWGIVLGYSPGNTIAGNVVDNCREAMYLYNSGYCEIDSNSFMGSVMGIELESSPYAEITDNTITENDIGVRVYTSDGSIICGNSCTWNRVGIFLVYSDESLVSGNEVTHNTQDGLGLTFADNNQITENIFAFNDDYGAIVRGPGQGNCFFENVFIDNNGATETYDPSHAQASDDGSNVWDVSGRGNYWSDWRGPDGDENGIVDSPYSLDGSAGVSDFFPLADTPIDIPEFSLTSTPVIVILTLLMALLIMRRSRQPRGKKS